MIDSSSCDKVAMRKTIAATVVAIDEAVGVVEKALEDAGMLHNTLIVFSRIMVGPQMAQQQYDEQFPVALRQRRDISRVVFALSVSCMALGCPHLW